MQELELINRFENDVKWFTENYQTIEQKFRNRYVAVENGEIIESDEKFNNLLEKLRGKNVNPANTLIKFVYQRGAAIIF